MEIAVHCLSISGEAGETNEELIVNFVNLLEISSDSLQLHP